LAAAQESSFHPALTELVLLTLMIVVLVGALIFMLRQSRSLEASRAAELSRGKAPAAEPAEPTLGHS
jgi:hypothetical protein